MEVLAFLVPFAALLYFAPSLVASRRKKGNTGAIFVLNLFFGWTLIGWVVSLVWAVTTEDPKPAAVPKRSGTEDLEKLAELKAKGFLTEAEFEAKKKEILGLDTLRDK